MARKPAAQTVHPEAIIEAAATVFRRKGYHGATMAEIAAAVNLTAGSLYHHFPSKQDLLVAVLATGLERITREVRAVVQTSSDSAADTLRRIAAVHIRSQIDNANIAAAVIFEGRALLDVPDVREQFVAQRDALEALYRHVVEEGIARNEFRPVDVGIFVKALFGALNWVSVWYRPDGRLSGEEIAREIADTFLAALHYPRNDLPGGEQAMA
ncbi:MAG: TetR/AcrR family transcriptional regulator [Aggregatilineaceae bacterium]